MKKFNRRKKRTSGHYPFENTNTIDGFDEEYSELKTSKDTPIMVNAFDSEEQFHKYGSALESEVPYDPLVDLNQGSMKERLSEIFGKLRPYLFRLRAYLGKKVKWVYTQLNSLLRSDRLRSVYHRISRTLHRVRLIPRSRLVFAAGLGLLFLLTWWVVASPDESDQGTLTSTIAGLQHAHEVREKPAAAESKLLMGHALFSKGLRHKALRLYRKALEFDPEISDFQLISNLTGSFGTKAQNKAAKLIVQHQITGAKDQLRNKLRHKRRAVRKKALQTLAKLGEVKRSDRVTFYLMDLRSRSCNIQRRAVDKLANLGDKRAIANLQAAGKRDKKRTAWYQDSCLGDTVAVAINKIRSQ